MTDDPVQDSVRETNEAFYRAFRERDYESMDQLWAQQLPVACIHPGMAPLVGRAEVMASWRGMLKHPGAPVLECSMVRVHLLGTSAIVTCLEGTQGELPKLVATNAFTLEDGRWKLVHHHGAALLSSREPPREPDRTLN